MYILFAILTSLLTYGLLVTMLHLIRPVVGRLRHLALGSLLLLITALVVFRITSWAVGIDLGPGHTVSYDIPGDYLAKGVTGLLALIPYTLACLSPILAYVMYAIFRHRSYTS